MIKGFQKLNYNYKTQVEWTIYMRFENMGLVAQEIGGDIIGQDDFDSVFTQWDI